MTFAKLCATMFVIAGFAASSHGQTYPAGPITLINPYTAGGPADVLARPIAAAMADLLGQQVVVLNKPGAATGIAAQQLARSPADGYTLLLSTASVHITTPILTKVSYDGIRDFSFVVMVANVPNVLAVRAEVPAKTVDEFIALAKQKPGQLHYGSVGTGSQTHLAGELFQQMTGTKLNHIPYKGAAPTVTDLLSGQIDLVFFNVPAILPHINSGKLRALATATRKRAEQLPDVPTLDELGLKGFDVGTWYGITAPANTPPAIVDKLAETLTKVLSSPDIKARFAVQGAEIFLLQPKEFLAHVQEDSKRLTDLIKTANIRAE